MSQQSKTNPSQFARRSNAKALLYLIVPTVLGSTLVATLSLSWPLYLLGQLCGAVFFAQAFILLHECGHSSFFETKRLNHLAGYLISSLVFIPFYNWRQIHSLHHKWTGWRDKDPTTEKTFATRLSPRQELLVNVCWRWSIPLFTIGYRFGIYWKAEKLKRHLSESHYRRSLREIYVYLCLYITTIVYFPKVWLALCPALLLSFVITDILSLSQHSHIEMKTAGSDDVRPLKYQEQADYSRSLVVPNVVSRFLFLNFNHHEAHHVYPGIPCYRLHQLQDTYSNSYKLIPWLRRVKSMKGVDFVFRSSAKRDGF